MMLLHLFSVKRGILEKYTGGGGVAHYSNAFAFSLQKTVFMSKIN